MLKWREFVHHWQKARAVFLMLIGVEILLVIVLVGIQSLPFFLSTDVDMVNQAGLQRARSQVFAKCALVLEYRSASEKIQALSDMQVILPLFEQEENVLMNNKDAQVQELLQQARSSYLAMVSAVQKVLSNNSSLTHVDTAQIDIILQNNRSYLTTMGSLVTVMQNDADEQIFVRFLVEAVLEVLLVGIPIFFGQHLFKIMFTLLEGGAVSPHS